MNNSLNAWSVDFYFGMRGNMLAQTVDGIDQRTQASLAQGGTLAVGCGDCTTTNLKFPNYGLVGGVTFADDLPDDLNGNVILDGFVVSSVSLPAITALSPAQLSQSGFNTIDVYSNGAVTLPAGTNIALAANGAVAVKSSQSILIDGNISAPGGQVSLQTASAGDLLPHDVTLGAGAVIDVSGSWTNDSPTVTAQPGTSPVVINGGAVAVNATGNVMLGADSLINVSGGGWINQASQLTAGSAGTISVAANYSLNAAAPASDPYIGVVDLGPGATLLGGSLKAGQGGTLSLQSGSVTVGASAAGTPGELLLAPGFFDHGGFAQYTIMGQNDVAIGNTADRNDGAPVTIAPLQQTLMFTQNALLKPTGSAVAGFTRLETLPLSERSPAGVSFIGTASDPSGAEIGDVTLARDASIVTDPGASVLLAANGYNGSVRVFGTIDAPAGSITLRTVNPDNQLQAPADPGFITGQEIELGADATLAAPAYLEVNTLNPHGYLEGSVLAGGTISLLANKGFVQTDPGSLINVSGAAGTLDIIAANGVTPTLVAGNAGTINIDAREGIVLQGDLLGQAARVNGTAVPGAGGGTLNVALGGNYSYTTTSIDNSSAGVYPTPIHTVTLSGVGPDGAPAVPPSNQLLSGTAVIDVGTIQSGGFDSVAISSADAIGFAGAVTLRRMQA